MKALKATATTAALPPLPPDVPRQKNIGRAGSKATFGDQPRYAVVGQGVRGNFMYLHLI